MLAVLALHRVFVLDIERPSHHLSVAAHPAFQHPDNVLAAIFQGDVYIEKLIRPIPRQFEVDLATLDLKTALYDTSGAHNFT